MVFKKWWTGRAFLNIKSLTEIKLNVKSAFRLGMFLQMLFNRGQESKH